MSRPNLNISLLIYFGSNILMGRQPEGIPIHISSNISSNISSRLSGIPLTICIYLRRNDFINYRGYNTTKYGT